MVDLRCEARRKDTCSVTQPKKNRERSQGGGGSWTDLFRILSKNNRQRILPKAGATKCLKTILSRNSKQIRLAERVHKALPMGNRVLLRGHAPRAARHPGDLPFQRSKCNNPPLRKSSVPICSIDLAPQDDDRLRTLFTRGHRAKHQLIIRKLQTGLTAVKAFDLLFIDGDHNTRVAWPTSGRGIRAWRRSSDLP